MKKEKLTRRFKRIVVSFALTTVLLGFVIAVLFGVFAVQHDKSAGEKAPQAPTESEVVRSPMAESLSERQPQADFILNEPPQAGFSVGESEALSRAAESSSNEPPQANLSRAMRPRADSVPAMEMVLEEDVVPMKRRLRPRDRGKVSGPSFSFL